MDDPANRGFYNLCEERMDIVVADVAPEGVDVGCEYDYGSPTEVDLENLGRDGELVGLLRPSQPWHGDRIAALARWRRLSPDSDAREPIPFCDGRRREAGRYHQSCGRRTSSRRRRLYDAKQGRFPMGIVNLLVAQGGDAARLNGSEGVLVRAAPEQVYELLCDVTRMGEWSPECFRCQWLSDAVGARRGARFRGHHRRGWIRWSTECTVTHYEPYRVFGFETKPPVGKAQSRWRFDLEPDADGALLRESFEVLWYVRPVFGLVFGGRSKRLAQLHEGVRQTLQGIKGVAEAT